DGGKLIVSAATAGHIDDLHIKGTDAGSKFAHGSLEDLFTDVQDKLPADVATTPGVSAFSMEMGKNMGKEGIASMTELQEGGIISAADVALAESVRTQVYELNKSGDAAAKEAFVADFTSKNPGSRIQFQLVRGTVLVPIVDTPKRTTTKLFSVFGPAGENTKAMWTAAPGRYMPKHPNPTQFSAEEMASGSFEESANAWFDTVMLTGNEPEVSETEVVAADVVDEVKSDAVESVTLQDPVKLFSQLLGSAEYRDGVIRLRTAGEREAISAVKAGVETAAKKRLNELKSASAMAALGETDIKTAQRRGKEWGMALKAVSEVSLDVDGEVKTVSVGEALNVLTAEGMKEKAEEIATLESSLVDAEVRVNALLDGIAADLEVRKDDPEFQAALAVWGNSPDSKGGRGVDEKGFHAGIIHYFEYRASKEKAGRYKREADGAFGIDGFIEHSKDLEAYVQPGADLKSMPEVQNFARLTDENGRERLLLSTDRFTISAFKWEDQDSLGIITVLPNSNPDPKGKNAKRFEKMLMAEIKNTSNDKGYLNHLGEERRLVDADDQFAGLLDA
ncbi:hypothetical protein HN709_02085, partial [Candidatus Peregrinibacteria bacterium]|nr:hypothetical protein [Candidatus Peregrinibacteria bacterium]